MPPVPFTTPEPARDDVDAMRGAVLLEFGINECPHCQAAQPLIADALERHPEVRHVRLEDGKALARADLYAGWPGSGPRITTNDPAGSRRPF